MKTLTFWQKWQLKHRGYYTEKINGEKWKVYVW